MELPDPYRFHSKKIFNPVFYACFYAVQQKLRLSVLCFLFVVTGVHTKSGGSSRKSFPSDLTCKVKTLKLLTVSTFNTIVRIVFNFRFRVGGWTLPRHCKNARGPFTWEHIFPIFIFDWVTFGHGNDG